MLTLLTDGRGAAKELHCIHGQLVAHPAAELRGDVFDLEGAASLSASLYVRESRVSYFASARARAVSSALASAMVSVVQQARKLRMTDVRLTELCRALSGWW